jgi:hypothetical protein
MADMKPLPGYVDRLGWLISAIAKIALTGNA